MNVIYLEMNRFIHPIYYYCSYLALITERKQESTMVLQVKNISKHFSIANYNGYKIS